MLGHWAVLLALSVTSFAAPSSGSKDVIFHKGLAFTDMRQFDKSGKLLFYLIDPRVGAQLRSIDSNTITFNPDKIVGTPLQFIPASSDFMNTEKNRDGNIIMGHIADAFQPDDFHLTVDTKQAKEGLLVTPIYERPRTKDDASQVDQFWSLDRSTRAVTFMGAPFVKLNRPGLAGYGPTESSSKAEDKVRLIEFDLTTAVLKMKLQGPQA